MTTNGRRRPPTPDVEGAPEGEGPGNVVAPDGLFQCPNGHESPVALTIHGLGDRYDGNYCMICYWQFMIQHTPKVDLVLFED